MAGPGALTLFGEIHGTEQAPAMFAAIVCMATVANPEGVLVGVEIPSRDQPAIDACLAAESDAAARSALLRAGHFGDEWADGRDSEAVVAMMLAFRRLRAAGIPISVVGYDGTVDPTDAGAREAEMTANLERALASHPRATALIYGGNLHNRLRAGVPWDAAFVPMGVRLRERHPDLVSLTFASAGGQAWVCMGTGDGRSTCGATDLSGDDRGPASFVEVRDPEATRGYHGFWYLGRVTSSPPAR